MNPFKDINSKTGLLRNEKSIHFGRYRLAANQVSPFREPNYDRLILKVEDIEVAKQIHEWFHDSLHQLFHLFKQSDIRANKYWEIDFDGDEQCLLVFEMVSNVKYIAIENIYFAFYHLALILEDSEYRIKHFRNMLSKIGAYAFFVDSVDNAIAIYDEFKPFDMMFLDHDLDQRVMVREQKKRTQDINSLNILQRINQKQGLSFTHLILMDLR